MFRVGFTLTVLLVKHLQALNPDCEHSKYVHAGIPTYIFSPSYPFRYSPGTRCRWNITCPLGYVCDLNCKHVNIPQTPSCEQDRLVISTSGDPQLEPADEYCGNKRIHAVSTDRNLTIELISSPISHGGRFLCRLTARIKPCACGLRNAKRIVGGNETKTHEFPMMAGLLLDGEDTIHCGGVVIEKRYVLTAAHCVVSNSVREVVLGLHDQSNIDSNSSESSATQRIKIASTVVHPLYNSTIYDYDIAILKLEKDIIYNDFVSPVCLPFKFVKNDFAGDNVTVIGWGTTFFGGPTSDVLLKVTLDVISQRSCRRSQPNVTKRQLCTYTPPKDSCQYDSGGPLLYTDPKTKLLFNIGIVSFGTSCASDSPAVNTRVTALLDWIFLNAPAFYCKK